MKLLPYILLEKHIYIFALKMGSSGNQHCASYISTLSFPMTSCYGIHADSEKPHRCCHLLNKVDNIDRTSNFTMGREATATCHVTN